MEEEEIRWSLKAIHDKIDILDYWFQRTKAKTYSEKLNLLFEKALSSIARNPEIGRLAGYKGIRIKVVGHYLIFYLHQENYIEVVRIWDARRNPDNLEI